MARVIVVSCDGHTGGPPETIRPYLESKYHDALEKLQQESDAYVALARPIQHSDRTPEVLEVIDGRGAIAAEGDEYGIWDPARRLQELDGDGIAAELLLSGHASAATPFFGPVNVPYPPELRMAGARAYHRWLADFMKEGHGRFRGAAESGPCLDMDETVQEIEWVAQNGFGAVMMPGGVQDPDLPALYDSHYESFWAACAANRLPLVIHAGWGSMQGAIQDFLKAAGEMMSGGVLVPEGVDPEEAFGRVLRDRLDNDADSPFQLDLGPRRVLWQLMLAGVFDRHPDLQLILTEVRADWVPATLAHLDQLFESTDSTLRMKPSEYFQRNCAVTPSSPRRSEIELRYEIGVERFMFGADFPHRESTWPNSCAWIRDAFVGVPEEEGRLILGENAIRYFGFDGDALRTVADRIGPESGDLFGKEGVDPRMVSHFHVRAGYSRPVEDIDAAALEAAVRQDLAAVGAAG
jgi:predicted TIM-barrel fold metal-dependent hydrolase